MNLISKEAFEIKRLSKRYIDLLNYLPESSDFFNLIEKKELIESELNNYSNISNNAMTMNNAEIKAEIFLLEALIKQIIDKLQISFFESLGEWARLIDDEALRLRLLNSTKCHINKK